MRCPLGVLVRRDAGPARESVLAHPSERSPHARRDEIGDWYLALPTRLPHPRSGHGTARPAGLLAASAIFERRHEVRTTVYVLLLPGVGLLR
jgi:hypothetical protein